MLRLVKHASRHRSEYLLASPLQSITERKLKEASLSLSLKPGLPTSIEHLNGTWVKVTGMNDAL